MTVDGVPVCKVLPDGKLEFKDKDNNRSTERGSPYVIVTVEEIKEAVDSQPQE